MSQLQEKCPSCLKKIAGNFADHVWYYTLFSLSERPISRWRMPKQNDNSNSDGADEDANGENIVTR